MAAGAAGVAVLAAVSALSVKFLLPPDDPARRPAPTRKLDLTVAEVASGEGRGKARLQVRGTTDLVDGAVLELAVQAGERSLETARVEVRGGSFALDIEAKGEIGEGQYVVFARFQIEAQTPTVAQVLGYSPRTLVARRPLTLPTTLVAAASVKSELRALIEELNQLPQGRALDDLDRRAVALEARLWISEQRVAVVKLRLAIEEARRTPPRMADFERLLLEAHALGGL